MPVMMTDKGAKINAYTGDMRPAIGITLLIIVIHIVIAAMVVDELDSAFWVVNIFLFVLYAGLFAVMAFQARYITITIHEKGIDWQRGSSHLFTTWDNMASIGRRNEGDATTYGIFLHEPMQPDTRSWLDERFFSTPVDYIRLIPTITVPTTFVGLEGNVIDWQTFAETDFGQDISRYAPHLLETA